MRHKFEEIRRGFDMRGERQRAKRKIVGTGEERSEVKKKEKSHKQERKKAQKERERILGLKFK